MSFWIGFIVGIFVGATIAFIGFSFLFVAREQDKDLEARRWR